MPSLSSDFGRVTRVIASAYDRTRVHQASLVRGEKRTLVVTLNGAMPKGRLITSATWRCDYCGTVIMSNPQISDDQRETSVDILANWAGSAAMRCEATLSNGETFIQLINVFVSDFPIFNDGASMSGPAILTVTA